MKFKFDRLRESLDEFLRQDEYPMLVVGCSSEALAYVVNFLQALEHELPSHRLVVLHQPFEDPRQWLDAAVAGLRAQLAVVEPPPPPLPFELEDGRCEPALRLQALLGYLLEQLPDPREHRLAVGLLPLHCADPAGFAELVARVIPAAEPPADRVAALRLIAWDDLPHPRLRPQLQALTTDHALVYADDFSTPALTDALVSGAADHSLPDAERMACMQQLAALDYAHRRYDEALAKYALLHEFHRERGEAELQALALLGAGDTLSAAGDPRAAKRRLQQGLAVALECRSLPALLQLLTSVTEVCAGLGEHADAESYADSGAQVAAAAMQPFAYCDLLAKRGDAQLAQGKLAEAVASFTRCRELCRSYAHHERWLAVLAKQTQVYARARMHAEAALLERERDEVEARMRTERA